MPKNRFYFSAKYNIAARYKDTIMYTAAYGIPYTIFYPGLDILDRLDSMSFRPYCGNTLLAMMRFLGRCKSGM